MASLKGIELVVSQSESLAETVERFASSVTRFQRLLAMQAANEACIREGRLLAYTEDDFDDLGDMRCP